MVLLAMIILPVLWKSYFQHICSSVHDSYHKRFHAARPLGGSIMWWCCLTSLCRVHRELLENREAREDQNWLAGSPRHASFGYHFQGQKVEGQLAGAWEYCGGLANTSLIFINSLMFMAPAAIGSRRSWRRRRKGWAAAGPQRPA